MLELLGLVDIQQQYSKTQHSQEFSWAMQVEMHARQSAYSHRVLLQQHGMDGQDGAPGAPGTPGEDGQDGGDGGAGGDGGVGGAGGDGGKGGDAEPSEDFLNSPFDLPVSSTDDEVSLEGAGSVTTGAEVDDTSPASTTGLLGVDNGPDNEEEGTPGADGAPGQDGSPGSDGAPGMDGAPGQDGSPGADGGADEIRGAEELISDAGGLRPPIDLPCFYRIRNIMAPLCRFDVSMTHLGWWAVIAGVVGMLV